MRIKLKLALILCILLIVSGVSLVAPVQLQFAQQAFSQEAVRPDTTRERRLYQEYISFLRGLDPGRIERDYVAAIRDIKSKKRSNQERGLRVLGASGEIDAIAWIAPLIESNDGGVRIDAGLALETIVSGYELRRRDMSHPDRVVILPRSATDIDLRTLAWLILKMMRLPDDGNTAAYAASMAGYLGLYDLEGELEELLKSRHSSVRDSARYALRILRERTECTPLSGPPRDTSSS